MSREIEHCHEGNEGRLHVTIQKAVIPVAGLGTRLLPATKSQPKEMLPVGRKPIVQYVVEELAEQGMKKILFVTGSKKRSIEDHFDWDLEFSRRVAESNDKALQKLQSYEEMGLSFFYTRQSSPKGLGDAVRLAEDFVDKEPFVVALGDSIIKGGTHAGLVGRLVDSHLSHRSSCTIAVTQVEEELVPHYGIIKPKSKHEKLAGDFEIEDIVEKPSPSDAPSRYAVTARYVFSPIIFDAIRRTPPEPGGELELTDAIKVLLQMGETVRCVKLRKDEKRYSVDGYEEYFKTFVDFALEDEKCGYMIRQYLQRKLREI